MSLKVFFSHKILFVIDAICWIFRWGMILIEISFSRESKCKRRGSNNNIVLLYTLMTLLDFKDLEPYQNDFIIYIYFNIVIIHHITPYVPPGYTGIQNFIND